MITLVYPYFDQPYVLGFHMGVWEVMRGHGFEIHSIIVDDHGPVPMPARDSVEQYRVDVDLGWSIVVAKNIGMHHAKDGWCIVGDLDHTVTKELLEFARSDTPERGKFYIFPRRLEGGSLSDDYHENYMLIHRSDFWSVGGYDEDFAGGYGWEDVWFKELANAVGLQRIKVPDVPIQAIGDKPGACMPREMCNPHRNGQLLQRKRVSWINSRKARLFAQNSHPLRHPYHEVTRESD